jgi:hypothetical protein
MRSTRLALVAVALTGLALAACNPPAPPHPATTETRYTCCNIYYEDHEIPDTLWKVGTMIPVGTPVRILKVGRNDIEFQATGRPPITLVLKYGKGAKSIDQYLNEMFPTTDPHAKLAKTKPKTRDLIEKGIVEPGMTRDQVLMSLGYPPAHRTPSLDAPEWHYWQNRWHQFVVYFDGNKVARVQQ